MVMTSVVRKVLVSHTVVVMGTTVGTDPVPLTVPLITPVPEPAGPEKVEEPDGMGNGGMIDLVALEAGAVPIGAVPEIVPVDAAGEEEGTEALV